MAIKNFAIISVILFMQNSCAIGQKNYEYSLSITKKSDYAYFEKQIAIREKRPLCINILEKQLLQNSYRKYDVVVISSGDTIRANFDSTRVYKAEINFRAFKIQVLWNKELIYENYFGVDSPYIISDVFIILDENIVESHYLIESIRYLTPEEVDKIQYSIITDTKCELIENKTCKVRIIF